MRVQRVRFSTAEAVGGGSPDSFRVRFDGSLASMTKPAQVFFGGTSSMFYDPPGGIVAHLNNLIVTDSTPPNVKSSSFVINNSQAATTGVSSIRVGVAYQQTPGISMRDEVALLQLIISKTASLGDGVVYDLTSSFDPATGRVDYDHKGRAGDIYYYWVRATDRSGNTAPARFIGSRDTLTPVQGSMATVADAAISFVLSLVP